MAKKKLIQKELRSNNFFQKNTNLVWLLPILIIIVLFFFVIYHIDEDNNNINRSVITTQSSKLKQSKVTESWKSYTNNKYGYTLKYPTKFFIDESNDPNGNIDTTTISNYEQKKFSSGEIDADDEDVFLMWISNPNQGDTTLEKEKNSYRLAFEKYTVDGIIGIKNSGDGKFGNRSELVIVVNNKKPYTFVLRSLESRYASTFDEILSTFKFIK